ncbi:MAG TPA: hypothetical protein VE172_14620 [Stackebrandtia sp.]|jgi:hypothetical protein|uniref:ABC transporter permease n=1 Tax=Stackebrandtia sp. TaxID=2023065 RepID=UPI002D6C38C3|nr:hypothetical protein [Stackebrandtia sp.]HZE40037.1 hypothetical protein [Stackebrandtia sp.]
MIWLTWRQHRQQALFTLIGLAVLAALIVPIGLAMRHSSTALGIPHCVKLMGDGAYLSSDFPDKCNNAISQFTNQYNIVNMVGVLLLFVPMLIGLFWGAPLVSREIDEGTHRLVWTQGVSRGRWALVKFGLVGAFTLVLSIAYGLGVSWTMTPLSQVGISRFAYLSFDMQGIVPIGYTLFAVAVGVLAGTIWHKALPAMGATIAVFIATRVTSALYARPHYMSPKVLTRPVLGPGAAELNPAHGDFRVHEAVRDAAGKIVQDNAQVGCPPTVTKCGGVGKGAYNWMQYQPGGRFWAFQSIETGIFIAIALLLIALAIRRVRRIS